MRLQFNRLFRRQLAFVRLQFNRLFRRQLAFRLFSWLFGFCWLFMAFWLFEEDISQYRFFTKSEYWQFRAVSHFHLKPIRPAGISVSSLPELLKSVAEHYPLITFHPEKKKPDICYIGPLVSMTEHTFTIEDLDSNGEWNGPRRMKFSDVTRIDFGGGYEEALAVTMPKRTTTRK
jgi:hypothetical protein